MTTRTHTMNERNASRNYGSRFKEHWNVQAGTVISTALPQSTGVTIARVTAGANFGLVEPVPAQDGYAVSLELRSFERGELWLDGRKSRQERLWKDHSVFYDLRHDVEAYLEDPFDFIQFHIPRDFLVELATSHDVSPVKNLNIDVGIGIDDPVIAHLGRILLPALNRPHEVAPLFMDHIALAMGVHIGHRYGGGFIPLEIVRDGLAPWQIRRAQELLDWNIDGNLSMAKIARECALTPSYFSRQFKRATGVTPVQWLQARRVERAKHLLRDRRMRMTDIAMACGFVDQSHFSRVFSQLAGTTPGAWRDQVTT